eukprot:1158397-Pelagomonas_calceolata.AAC.11
MGDTLPDTFKPTSEYEKLFVLSKVLEWQAGQTGVWQVELCSPKSWHFSLLGTPTPDSSMQLFSYN